MLKYILHAYVRTSNLSRVCIKMKILYTKKVLSHMHVKRPINFKHNFFSYPDLKRRSFEVGLITPVDVKL
jgi:hypothetical protein